jgi:hypothetical protein
MFPFNYIPDSIDPKLRKILIILITIQFICFLAYIILLTYQHIIKKREARKLNKDGNKSNEENKQTELKNDENKSKKKKE